jgi:hypothetical protein
VLHLRSISLVFIALLVLSVQCRAKCLVAPEPVSSGQHAPDCPLHKKSAPVESKCSHAPQTDFEQAKDFFAILPTSTPTVTLAVIVQLTVATPISLERPHLAPIPLRI